MEHAKEIAPWAAIIISLITLFWQMASTKGKNWREYTKDQDERYEKLVARMTEVETKMELFWEATKETVRNLIKQPTHKHKDELVDEFMDKEREMDVGEIYELKQILINEQMELIQKKEAKALVYNLLLYRVNQELHRRGCLGR